MKSRLLPFVILGLACSTGCKKKEDKPQPPSDTPAYVPIKTYQHATKPEELAEVCADSPERKFGGSSYMKLTLASPVALMMKWGDSPTYESWNYSGADAWIAKDPYATQLVVCVTATKVKKVRDCQYTGAKLELFDATYEVVVRDASSAKELAKKTYDLRVRDCPDTWSFAFGTSEAKNGPNVFEPMLELVAPLQPEGAQVEPPKEANSLIPACEGSPLPRQAAYAPAPGKVSPLFAFFEPEEGGRFGGAKSKVNPEPGFMAFRDAEPFKVPGDKIQDYQLVACMTGKPKDKLLKKCPFGVGERVLAIVDGEVEVVVREAKTNKEVGRKSFPSKADVCPDDWGFAVAQMSAATVGVDRKAMEAWLTTLVKP